MRVALIFVVAVGLVSAKPSVSENLEQVETAVGERNGPIENAILNLLEVVREIIVTGTDTIPPLDPLVVGRIHVDDNTLPIPGAVITLNDMVVRGISTFRMDALRLSIASILPLRNRMDFDLVIPTINVDTSSYNMFIRVFGGDIYGNGDMRLAIVNTRVKGNIVVAIRRDNGVFITITSCKISFGLDAFKPVITGMFHNEASSEFVSRFLSNLIPEMLDFFEEEITNFLSTAVLVVGNLVLAELDISTLLPISAQAP